MKHEKPVIDIKFNVKNILLYLCLTSSFVNAAEESPIEITVVRGEQYEICQEYAAELREHNVSGSNYCGIAIPLDNPNYRLPEWTDMNPAENMELVKTFYYWHNMSSSRTHELYAQQESDGSVIVPELLDLYWPKAETQVLALVESGAVQLQASQFDIDFDGVVETVYRMTPLIRLGGARDPRLSDIHQVRARSGCNAHDLPDGESGYLYYFAPSELPKHKYGGFLNFAQITLGGFFYWKDRIYWDWGRGGIYEPHSTDYVGLTQICGMNIRTRSIGND